MITTVTNFGDSLGVRFPASLLRNAQISENDDVELLVMDNSIVIKQRDNKKRFTTKERIAAFCATTDYVHLPEIEWGKPQGKEIW